MPAKVQAYAPDVRLIWPTSDPFAEASDKCVYSCERHYNWLLKPAPASAMLVDNPFVLEGAEWE